MTRNYLKIAFRNIWKNKTQSLIGIFGLAFGLACFIPALYWLKYEMTYDSFYQNSEQIYRIYTFDKQNAKSNDLVSGILERRLNEQLPAMNNTTVFFIQENDFRSDLTEHAKLQTVFTDSTFLHVFPQQLISGDYQKALQTTNSVILTEKAALRLFGDTKKAVGQKIKSTTLLKNDAPYTVTAVIKDTKANTNISFEAILAHDQIQMHKSFTEESGSEIWNFAMLQMYAKVPKGSDVRLLSSQLKSFPLNSYKNSDIEVYMLPVKDVRHRLNPNVPFTLNFIRLFIAAGILLLFCAMFNFLSLYYDLFRERAREFRLRYVNGATSKQLTGQMIFEITCAIAISTTLSFLFILLSRPALLKLNAVGMIISDLIILFVPVSVIVTLILLIVSYFRFKHMGIAAIKPQTQNGNKGKSILQRTSVTLQLAVSIIIIIASSVVMMQMHYINHKDLGLKSEGIIYLSKLNPFIDPDKREALVSRLRSLPNVISFTETDYSPQHNVNPFQMTTNVEWQGKAEGETPAFNFITTDSHFAETFGVNMSEGEWLNDSGESKVILNEEAVRTMGLKNPVGSIIRIKLNDDKQYRVIGVVKDFHTLSLRSRILPTLLVKAEYPTNKFYLRAAPGHEKDVIEQINKILPDIDPAFADAEPVTLNELYDRLNDSEQAGVKLFSILAIVCLLISLIGVYAAATTGTERRRKEIAIRKVSGAKVGDIINMFFKEYTMQVILSAIIGLPVAYAGISRWLEGYAYKTNIPWWLFAAVVAAIIILVLSTATKQVITAANGNPANVIKSE